MTRRRHDCDVEATEDAHFEDRRSYITHDGHEYLFGADVGARRREVYERDGGKCQAAGCGKWLPWDEAQMHHRKGGLSGRCTCMHNLEIQCPSHHGERHVRPMWTRRDPSV